MSGGASGRLCRGPVPGQEIGKALSRVVGDAGEDVSKVCLGIETVQLGALDEAVEYRRALGAPVGAGEQVVLAPDGDTAKGSLGRVVVERDAAVVEDSGQRRPSRQHVAKRAGQFGAAGELREDRLGPG